MATRLDRLLANNGLGSRTDVRHLLRAGRVTVGGEVERRPDRHAEPADVAVDGEPLEHPDGLLVAVHKPVGHVCSHADHEGPSVFGLLPGRWMARSPRPEAIGRLDRDSSGLLLVTDRHDLVHRLGSAGREVPKRYQVLLAAAADVDRVVEVFAAGTLVLDGSPCRPAVAHPLDGAGDRFEVVLTEGRHRQVRRMFAALGHDVVGLHRVAVGPYELGDLAPGAWRLEAVPVRSGR